MADYKKNEQTDEEFFEEMLDEMRNGPECKQSDIPGILDNVDRLHEIKQQHQWGTCECVDCHEIRRTQRFFDLLEKMD